MKVYFIGAGPGDPELITVKALKAIEKSPVILYAGSLVPRQIIEPYEAAAACVVDTASIDLDEIMVYIQDAHKNDQNVARVHSGDPSLYGAIGEQIRRLEQLGIDYEIIPGVTATSASAAWLGKELTLSGVSQTIIMTRYEGKTPFPVRASSGKRSRSGNGVLPS